MKKTLYILILLLFWAVQMVAQNVRLQIINDSKKILKTETLLFNSAKLMQNFVTDTINSFQKKGYLNVNHQLTNNDSIYVLHLNPNNKIENIVLNTNNFDEDFKFAIQNLPKQIKFEELEEKLQLVLKLLEENGYGLSKIQLKNHKILGDTLFADLINTKKEIRNIEEIVLNGYDKFPEGVKKDILRKFKNKHLNESNLYKIKNYIDQLSFIKQIKYPEILFEKNKTTLYTYVEKNKANKFDGFFGFGTNDEGKLKFNGYLDLNLNNIINKGERTTILWKTDGNEQSTFNFKTEIPYVFKTPLGIDFDISIFKQDSTFQNTNTNYGLVYMLDYNTRIKVGLKNTASTYTAQNFNNYENFKSKFYTVSFIKEIIDTETSIFRNKGKIETKIGFGNRESENTVKQIIAEINADYNFKLNLSNYIYTKNTTYFIKSDSYLTNELYRIGGINTLRGFNENSLQGNTLSSIMVEYRYLLNQSIYIHTITDFSYIKDNTLKLNTNAYSFGFGLGFITNNNLFKLNYANGNTKNAPFKLKNSLFHISLNTTF